MSIDFSRGPAGVYRTLDTKRIGEYLRAHPGEWVQIEKGGPESYNRMYTKASNYNRMPPIAFTDKGFEFRARRTKRGKIKIFGRFIPHESPPATPHA